MKRFSASVDDYIASQPQAFRGTLEEIRSLVKAAAPKAEEVMSYGVPVFKHLYMLVGLGATKEFYSLYVMNTDLAKK
jgi:uncharacterized protein YdhG (YjbR/CyaY superfamily)